jgi:hypothetical protein
MNHVHQELDESGLAGSVVADQGEDGSAGDVEGERMQGLGAAVSLGEGVSLDGVGHGLLGAPKGGDHWRLA